MNSSSSRLILAGLLSASLAVLAGCANNTASSEIYTYAQTQRLQFVRLGTVLSVRPVTIEKSRTTGVGAVAGGALGGIAASAIGAGTGRILAALGGALLGAGVGNTVENQMDHDKGLDITVKLDDGEIKSLVQSADMPVRVGQRVRITGGQAGQPVRLAPM